MSAEAAAMPTRVGKGSFFRRIGAVRRRLAPHIRRHRRWLVSGTLGTLLVVACRLSFPWPLRGVLELAFEEQGSEVASLVPSAGDPVLWLGGAFVAIVLTQGLAELIQRVSFARFSIGLVHDARGEALERLARPGDAGAASHDPGDLIARVIGDSARFKAGLKGILIRMTQNGAFVVGVCVMLLVIDLPLGLAFLGGTTLILTVAGFGATRVNRISQRLRKKEGKLASHMHAVLSGQEGELADVEASERQAGHAEAKTTKLEGLVIWGVHALLALTTCSVLVLGLQGVRSGRLAAADLFTVLFYLLLVHNPTVRFGRQAVRVGRVLASAERLVRIMDEPARVRAAGLGVAAAPRAPRRTEPADSRGRQSHERAAGPVR